MIDRIRGTLLQLGADMAVVDVQGWGLRIELSPSTAERLPGPGQEITLFTQLLIPGNDPTPRLMGFAGEDERQLFRLLLGVAGIGPAHALRLLGALPEPGQVAAAIAQGDLASLKVKGVGPKLAKRVVAELKDKLEGLATLAPSALGMARRAPGERSSVEDALRALHSLEFEPQEARRLLGEVCGGLPQEASADELVRAVLLRV